MVHTKRIEEIKIMLSFYYCFIVDSIGRSGGLALFWRKPFGLINFSQNFINVEVHHPENPTWRLTRFYDLPERSRRKYSWDLLHSLATDKQFSWCIIGHFNDLLSTEDKKGRVDHPLWPMQGFHDVAIILMQT